MSDYSLLKSSLTLKSGLEYIKGLGYKKVVLADENLSGVINFYKTAKQMSLEPVIGLQKWIDDIKYLLIAKNSKGYSLLCQLESGIEIDLEDENLIPILMDIKREQDFSKVKAKFATLTNNEIIKKADQQGKIKILPITVGNAIDDKDFYAIASLRAIDKQTVYEKEALKQDFYFHKVILKNKLIQNKDLISLFSQVVDDYSFGHPKPPQYKFGKEIAKKDVSNDDLFEALAWKGLQKRFKNKSVPETYIKRLQKEIEVIKKMGFSGYFLIVWDYVKYAKQNDIPVGPGRGSAAGSLVAYALGITDLDPIPYNLLFERFLNPERVNLPDIDMDFSQEKREEIIEYIRNKYGKEATAQVITFGTIGSRVAIRDAARIINAPLYLADKMAKMIDDPKISLKEAFQKYDSFRELIEKDFVARKIYNKALQIEGLKRSQGIHAAGFVMANEPLYYRAPLYNVNGVQVLGYEGNYLEDVDLVKYDLLGLKTLDVIHHTLKSLGLSTKKFQNIDLNIPEIYNFLSTGNTVGIFQLESEGMQQLCKRLKPSSFEELIAVLALYRPGPLDAGMVESYIKRKHGEEKVDYFFPCFEETLKPILEPTYGMIVYQEQVMQIVQAIAGFSLGEADLVRRAMGKKKKEEMEKISQEFVERAVKNGFPEEESRKLFEMIEKFAGYGFNKSHSAAYAFIAYQTAYLKYYYPEHFMASLLNSDIDKDDKIVKYVEEAKKFGIKIKKPNLKYKNNYFKVEEHNRKKYILFGLKGIKGLGEGATPLFKALDQLGENASLLELLKNTQRNIKKEVNSVTVEENKIKRKIDSLNKKIDKINTSIEKRLQKKVTPKSQEYIEKKREEVSQLIQNVKDMTEELAQLTAKKELLMQEEETSVLEKINKRVLEALIESGALDDFGYTRKDLMANIDVLLDPNRGAMKITNEEFDIKTLIQMEKERNRVVFTSILPKDKALEIELGAPDGYQVALLLSKESRKSKNGNEYYVVNVLTSSNKELILFDFKNKTDNLQVGTLVYVLISDGKYKAIYDIREIKEDT